LVEVAIIGLGSWGLCALERIIDAGRRAPSRAISVHVVDPGRPGGGLYSQASPDYLILNTPCGHHSMYPYPEQIGESRLGKSFYEWVVERGYRWHGHECRISSTGQAISPYDFLPRRLMGEYLEWFYQALLMEAPANVSVVHHKTRALDIEATPYGREAVHMENGTPIEVDHVILTLGHTEEAAARAEQGTLKTSPYPVERYLATVSPRHKVAVEGMGLVALDVVAALTVGLGGRFTTEPSGNLRYHPSGREPTVYLFSRSGYPFCAKSIGTADPVGGYEPAICTAEAVRRLHQSEGGNADRPIDARKELLPLVFGEMTLRYYTHSAELEHGPEAAARVHADLVGAWVAGTFEEACASYAVAYGTFDAAEHLLVGEGATYLDRKEYEAQVYASTEADVSEALVHGGASPVKAAFETLRALRDILRSAVEFKGLTLSSHLDFQSCLQKRLARPVAGPPVFRSQQLLALMDADVVRMPFGPSPEVTTSPRGRAVIRSTRLERPCEVEVDRLICGHLDLPSVVRPKSPLLANLARKGRVRPLTIESTPVGSIDLSTDFHPINARGVEPRLWVFGVVTEGVRYFTLYIPSPKSRVRAFVDAEFCANEMLGIAG
jgi:FAD-NAD(P)-binding